VEEKGEMFLKRPSDGLQKLDAKLGNLGDLPWIVKHSKPCEAVRDELIQNLGKMFQASN
jgi:hypothetical protein